MTPATLDALKASIVKWDNNTHAMTPADAKVSGDTCPLCALFYDEMDPAADDEDNARCHGCPIKARTGHSNCHSTPWMDAWNAKHQWISNPNYAPAFIAAAVRMRDHLISLLPADSEERAA
ncbi:hypothetical protein [Pleomorphomonas oryzae]|uniref:hypothetical protein n=1 Tax=Pleomorphomonas oryzae TaxID=261934 RepID=UPI000428236C|nr:hypothetical protein [Pleomorphomonas oryzae]